MNCNIITIGDEILIGQIVDTNQPWMAQRLNEIGISVRQMLSISDTESAIYETLESSLEKVDLVIITGGLGPTNDDITKKTLTHFFGDSLVLNQEILTHIRQIFEKMNFSIKESDVLQAMLPSKAHFFKNNIGTATGMCFQKNGKIVISLPGVPSEMKHLMQTGVLPYLREKYKLPIILHKTLVTYGLRESDMAVRLIAFEKQLPKHITLAYLPNYSRLRLRLTGKANDEKTLVFEMEHQVSLLTSFLNDIVVGYEYFLLEEEVGSVLRKKNKTLATAESCTGGNIAHILTMTPGASTYFKGSIVSYASEIKIQELDIEPKMIATYSVVSEEVAAAMALHIQKKFKTDYAISTTGNAGPTTDLTDKSVGDVYIGIATPKGVNTHFFNFGQPREKVIYKTTSKALELLYKEILKTM